MSSPCKGESHKEEVQNHKELQIITYIFIHELNTNENFELEEFATRGFYRF
ncbi:hypothetical protein BD770DRAFT_468475 [Pilaira anomala]|nr:hypothetical protein BD770DRAFT_468475 [Pilaira anomala]